MENGEYNFEHNSASRPQRSGTSGASRESTLFTEIPLESVRRTPNSGRPASSTNATSAPQTDRRTARTAQTQGTDRSMPRAVPYTPQSAQRQTNAMYGNASQQGRPSRTGSAASFTEISWDNLKNGNLDAAMREKPTQPQTQQRPYAVPAAQQRTNPPQEYASYGNYGGYRQRNENQPQYRSAPQTPQYDPDPFYGGAPQRETPAQQPYAAQRGHGDYYRPGAVHRPAARSSAARSSSGTIPPRTGVPKRKGPRFPRGGQGRLHPAFYVGGAVLVLLIILGVVKLAQKSSEKPLYTLPSYAPVTATPAPTDVPEQSEASETTEEEATPTPRPTAEPTPTPSGAKAQRSGNLIVPADWGATVPERTNAVYDSFFDRSCMIGNSLVEGFFMWSGMTNMRYIYNTGAVVSDVIGTLDLSPLTLNDPDYYENIYLMFGLNEVGTDVNSFIQSYQKLVEYIRQYQTEANIYIISVTPVTQEVDADANEVQSMDRIDTFNSALKQFCVDQNCWYLDIYSMLLDENGYLSADYAYEGDGKHFEKSGYVAWANYMKTHYVDEDLLTE